jgi:hypothetical protein
MWGPPRSAGDTGFTGSVGGPRDPPRFTPLGIRVPRLLSLFSRDFRLGEGGNGAECAKKGGIAPKPAFGLGASSLRPGGPSGMARGISCRFKEKLSIRSHWSGEDP